MYGYDAAKHVKGRKRHILVDTQGLLLGVLVTQASMPERLGAAALLWEFAEHLPRLALIWVDQGYSGKRFSQTVKDLVGAQVEVVKRQSQKFEVLPRRWVVERTFAWLYQQRRLVVDYEQLPEISETVIYAAMTRLMLRRLTHQMQTA